AGTGVAVQPAPSPPARGNSASEDLFWQSIVTSGDAGMFQAYLDQVQAGTFSGTYKALAQIRLAALAPKTVAPPPAAAPPAKTTLPAAPIAPTKSAAPPDTAQTSACDREAADARDPEKPAAIVGVALDRSAGAAAIADCSAAVRQKDAPRRAYYQLGRAYE